MARKIYTGSRMDKLGVKPDSKVAVIGVKDPVFLDELRARAPEASIGRPRNHLDLIFFGADSLAQLRKLARLKGRLKAAGAIWVVSRKGKAARIKDVEIIAAAIQAGLVDNKVVGFSETHTALRLVIPVARRGK